MDILHRWSSLLAVFIGLCLFLLMVVMPAPAAGNAEPDCSYDSIGTSFVAGYPQAVSKSEPKIKKIQTLLKKAGYDPVRIDGFLGDQTYKALEQFCSTSKDEVRSMQLEQINKVSSPNDLANILVEILSKIADQPLTQIDDQPPYLPYLQKLVTHADDQPKEIILIGDGCGCSRDFEEHAQVYGFYPHWLADGEKHIVDFSLFDRIGYFALTLNEQGHITHNLHFPTDASSDPNIARFIKQAHIHRVKVDVTFVASSWQNWNVDQINNAVDNIVETVTRRYEIEKPKWWRKHLPLVENYSTAKADGINLYFDRYENPDKRKSWKDLLAIVNELADKDKPEPLMKLVEIVNEQAGKPESERKLLEIVNELADKDKPKRFMELVNIVNELAVKPESGRKLLEIVNGSAVSENGSQLVNIVNKLAQKLKQVEPDAKLNIMLGLNLASVEKRQLDVGTAAPKFVKQYREREDEFHKLEGQFRSLEKILNADQKIVDNVFVFLTQNTSKSKKNLRQIIENAFDGAARQTVLRKIVPIVAAQGLGQEKVRKVTEIKDKSVYGDGITPLKDNLIYMKDNFAGIGLWYLPLTQENEVPKNEIAEKAAAEKAADEKAAAEKAADEIAAAEKAAEEMAVAAKEAEEEVKKKVAELETAAEVARILSVNTEDDTDDNKDEEKKDKAVKKVKEIDSAKTAVKQAKKALEAAKMNVESANTAVEKANSDLQLARTEAKVVADKKAMQDDVEALREALKSHFQPKSDFQPGSQFAFLGKKFEDIKFKLCEWACPNRWMFRIAMDVLIVLALLYWLWALVDCRLREFYQRRFLWFTGYGVMIAMVFAVSAACDPSLKDNALKVMFGILLLIPVGWGISRIRKMNQPLLP